MRITTDIYSISPWWKQNLIDGHNNNKCKKTVVYLQLITAKW